MTETTRPGRRHHGMTIVEMAIAMVVSAILVGLVYAVWSGAARSSRVTGAHLSAIQSVLIASHALRNDLSKILFTQIAGENQSTQGNIRINEQGYRLEFHVPQNVDTQRWTMDLVPVVFTLKPVPGEQGAYQLVRKDAQGERVISGCLLGGIHFQYLQKGSVAPYRGFLQVTLEGIDQPRPRARFPASLLIPISQTLPPAAFCVDPAGFRQNFPSGGAP